MYFVIDNSIDPWWNLAAEEYLFKKVDKPIFRLWQNNNAIIIGHHQNAYAEINTEYVRDKGIKVVRRLTGGGAVFHDLGNVNFTFIDNVNTTEDSAAMFARFTKPIIDALKELKVDAYLEGRNDLLIDGKKFSGNAVARYKNRLLQHGTLLFSASMTDLSNALASRPEKFTGKSVQSNRSRVTNISEHLTNSMTIDEFINHLHNFIAGESSGYTQYCYSEEDIEAIKELRDTKYSLDSWNYGKSPSYSYSKIIKFPAGLLELYLQVEKGIIEDIKIYGDYFFNSETEELEDLIRGCRHSYNGVKERLGKINLSDYISNIEGEEFLSLFWE
ncbi:MAG: lipoate--protein ligase [Bacteroidales bacterium]|jgi:lipoate-protein ligase A|nr:lipoate--protein ligase [Bacteroidales bacterium]MDD3273385.1 lipoate--protein ligase [Bacteroidales bacterium]